MEALSTIMIIGLTVLDNIHFVLLYYTVCLIMHCFADESYTMKKRGLLFIVSLVLSLDLVNLVVGALLKNSPTSAFMNAYSFLTSMLLAGSMVLFISYKKGAGVKAQIKRFIGTMFIYLLILFNEIVAKLLISSAVAERVEYLKDYTQKSFFEHLYNFAFSIAIVSGFVIYIYHSYYKKNVTMKLRKTDVIFLVGDLFFLLFVGMTFGTIDQQHIPIAGDDTALRLFMTLCVLALVLALPIILMRARVSVYYKELTNYQQTFLETELNASRQYKAAQEDTRAFRHDVQNNLSVVSMLMEQGKMDEAQQYINDMRTEVNALSPKVVTGDEMLDSLVSSKLAKMEELGIKFRLDGVIDGGLDWKPMDTCTVFANMLDNAIEAASKCKDPFIELSFRKTDHHRLVSASNSCAEVVDCEKLMSGESHITSKEDKSLHGYGLGNIRRTVEKYGGMMRLFCKDNVFGMELMLPK